MKQLTQQEAIELAETGMYLEMSAEELFSVQIRQEYLFSDFGVFQDSASKVLGRPIWTHEFASAGSSLMDEYHRTVSRPTEQELIDMIPKQYQHYFKD